MLDSLPASGTSPLRLFVAATNVRSGQLQVFHTHELSVEALLADGDVASKFNLAWPFLTALRDRGRHAAAAWLGRHAGAIGRRSTVDLHAEFLDPHTRLWAAGDVGPAGAASDLV